VLLRLQINAKFRTSERDGQRRRQAWVSAELCKMSLSSTMKQTGQESGCQLIPQFRIVVVFAVKRCKWGLQTASAAVGFIHFRPHTVSATASHMNIHGAAIGDWTIKLLLMLKILLLFVSKGRVGSYFCVDVCSFVSTSKEGAETMCSDRESRNTYDTVWKVKLRCICCTVLLYQFIRIITSI